MFSRVTTRRMRTRSALCIGGAVHCSRAVSGFQRACHERINCRVPGRRTGPGRGRRDVTRQLWSVVLAAGLLWPARTLGPLDGLPLNGTAEAIVIAVAIPFLWVTHRQFLDARWVRGVIVLLVSIKVIGAAALTQQGLCARFSTPAPFHTTVLTIPIDEPLGVLRSWDVRADWRSDAPACTAIIDRPYQEPQAFPAWFSNLARAIPADDVKRIDMSVPVIEMQVHGVITVMESGQFSIETG